MSRQKHIFLIAFACSLALHAASLGVYVEYAHLHGGLWATPDRAARKAPTTEPADELIVYPEMGDDQGSGIGSNSSPGERPMEAREADEDQALLSRNPQGAGRFDLPPEPQRGPVGEGKGGSPGHNPSPAPAVAAPLITQTPMEQAKSEAEPEPTSELVPHPVQVASAIPLPGKEVEKPVEKVEKSRAPSPAKPQAAEGDGKRPGVPPAAGNPLPQSESDSDPFSRISGNIIVPRVGRLEPRLGRKVKTTRPQVNIAGEIDLIALNNPTVVLEVHIAATGKVTDVKIAHSSGSNAIDEPTRVAVYDWWFEPARDKTGKPVPDVTFFAVKFI